MKVKNAIFFQNETNLEVLLTKNGELYSLPNLELEAMKPLSKREGHLAYFSIVSSKETFKESDWVSIEDITALIENDGAILCEALGKLWPIFENNSYKIPKLFCKDSFNLDSAVFYGGSFNPWHKGHSECLNRCNHPNIVIIPDSNPWKDNTFDNCFFSKYLELCKKFEDSPYSVFSGFYGLESSNPTASWLPKTLFKESSLLMGDDNFYKIFDWKNPKELLSSLKSIYVLSRDYSVEELKKVEKEVLSLNSSLQIHYLGDHEFMNLSSTKLRDS
jgi:nicotinate-nucleotide adenylyltransferase